MKAVLSSGIFWIIAMCLAWVGAAYWFLYKRNSGNVVLPGMGTLRDDKDVIVGRKEVVVNLVFASSSDVDPSLLADMTVNVADIMSGTYGVNGRLKSEKTAEGNVDVGQGEEGPEEDDGDEYVDLSNEPELNTDLREEEERPVVQDVRKVSEPVDLKEFNL